MRASAFESGQNTVQLVGRVSKARSLRYFPSGKAVLEITLAVAQDGVEKASVGYFELLLLDRLAEQTASEIKIGVQMKVSGSLWFRKYRDRNGNGKEEYKIIVHSIGGSK